MRPRENERKRERTEEGEWNPPSYVIPLLQQVNNENTNFSATREENKNGKSSKTRVASRHQYVWVSWSLTELSSAMRASRLVEQKPFSSTVSVRKPALLK